MERYMYNADQIKQPISFIGGERGNCSLTDLDGGTEYGGKYLMLIEVKRKGVSIPTGQRLFLERILDRWVLPNKLISEINAQRSRLTKYEGFTKLLEQEPLYDAWGFKLTHTTPDEDTIYIMDCIVDEYYHNGKWVKSTKGYKFGDVYKDRLDKWGIKKD